jgi:hypothetical protein
MDERSVAFREGDEGIRIVGAWQEIPESPDTAAIGAGVRHSTFEPHALQGSRLRLGRIDHHFKQITALGTSYNTLVKIEGMGAVPIVTTQMHSIP